MLVITIAVVVATTTIAPLVVVSAVTAKIVIVQHYFLYLLRIMTTVSTLTFDALSKRTVKQKL